MRYLKTKAYKTTKIILEWELYRVALKYCIKNQCLPTWLRQFAILELSYLPLQSSLSHLKLRCLLSNQRRSILTFFKLNRMRLKMANASGLVNGLKKGQW